MTDITAPETESITVTEEKETTMNNSEQSTLPPAPESGIGEQEANSEPMFSMDAAIADILQESGEDKTSAFRPDNLRVLVQLQAEDPSEYEKLRIALQKVGVIVGRLDAAVAAYKKSLKSETAAEAKNQTTDLLGIANAAEYFRDPDEIPYADIISEDGYRQTYGVTSEAFKKWLRGEYYKKNKASIASEVLNTTIATLAARAQTEGTVHPVALRCGKLDDKVYIDLCNDKWQAIEVSKDGYKIVDNPPLRFRRRKGMKALPMPERGGSVFDLKPFVNVSDKRGFVLIISWLLAALSGQAPFPVLVVVGEQGTAKSTLMSFLRDLVDPNAAPLRTLPREVRDLFIAANSGWILAFDNLSNMQFWISDALCRLATGGGFATRTLYTDEDEMLFNAARPIMLNGIDNVAPRGDLIDRAIVLMLDPIPEENRKTAKELNAAFAAACPKILGALLDMLAHGLRMLPETKLDASPRMADFAHLAAACETAVWPQGTFMEAYEANRSEANEDIVAASVLATAVNDFMKERDEPWEGTATDLLACIRGLVADEYVLHDKKLWPSTSRVLSERLRRVASALRKAGIGIEHMRGKDSVRHIRLTRAPVAGKPATCATSPTAGDDVLPENTTEQEAAPNKTAKYKKRGGSKGDKPKA